VSRTLVLTVSDSLGEQLDTASKEFLADILERGLCESKIERALERYARGGISFGAAAHRAGVSQSELARHAYARGIEPPFTDATLLEELG